jgi:hypothetical protein
MRDLLIDFGLILSCGDLNNIIDNCDIGSVGRVVIKIPNDFGFSTTTYPPYDVLTFIETIGKDITVVLDKDLSSSTDLSYCFHFLAHTNSAEIIVNFNNEIIADAVKYFTLKANIAILSKCIDINCFNACINIQFNEDSMMNDLTYFVDGLNSQLSRRILCQKKQM